MNRTIRLVTYLSISLIFYGSSFAQEPLKKSTPDPRDVVMGKAIYLARPLYSQDAILARVSGVVNVKITIDEKGNVIEAKAKTGDARLNNAAETAALSSKFTPTTLQGNPIQVTATISFNFKLFDDWEGIAAALVSLENGKGGRGYGKRASDINWQGFDEERKQLDELLRTETTEGKPELAKRLIASISEKLQLWNPQQFWYFNLGLLTGRLTETAERLGEQEKFSHYFIDLVPLIRTAPTGIPQDRLDFLLETAKRFSKDRLERSERKEIVRLLIESYNQKLTTLQ